MNVTSRLEKIEREANFARGCSVCDYYARDRFIFKNLATNYCGNCGATITTFKIEWDDEFLAVGDRLDALGTHAEVCALAAIDPEVRALLDWFDERVSAQRALAERAEDVRAFENVLVER